MKKISKNILFIVLMIAFTGNRMPVFAQYDLTLYPMSSIPQSNYNNPALIPDCKIYIGSFPIIPVPVMPSIYLSVNSSGFNYSNAVHKVRVDSNYLDLSDMIRHLAKKNYVSTKLHLELLSFGFKIRRVHYISLGLYEKVNLRFCYPKDLISMIWYGNSQFIGSEANFNGIGLDWMHYRELALSYSYIYNDKWTIGVRPKLLFGLSNLWTKKSKATIGIDENYYDFTFRTGLEMYSSVEDELMSRIEDSFDDDNDDGNSEGYNPMKYLFNFKNLGGALDLGVSYKISKYFSVALSAVDFGYIHWKTGARRYVSPDTTFVFDGFDIAQVFRKGDTSEPGDYIDKLIDSVSNYYQFNKTEEDYWCPLNPMIYLSGYYTPSKRDKISLLTRLEIYKHAVHPAVTLGYFRTFGNDASFGINYSYYNRSWFNLGFGASYKIGPMQFWFTTDNLFSLIMPYKIKNANLHVGCNLVFYYKNYYPLLETHY